MVKRRCANTIIDNRKLAEDGIPYSDLRCILRSLLFDRLIRLTTTVLFLQSNIPVASKAVLYSGVQKLATLRRRALNTIIRNII
jgi:hypothetical protein